MWIRSRLTFANVVSLIALFVALGGTGYAAITLPKNSVGAKQIKKNAVKAPEIARNAVKAPEIARNAVGSSEIRSNAVAGGDVADGGIGSLDILDGNLTASDLGDNSVGAGELADNSVLADELADNSVGNGELADNSVGSTEVINGALGASDLRPDLITFTVQRFDYTVNNGSANSADVGCPAGQQAIAGGGSTDATAAGAALLVSRPGEAGFNPTNGETFTTWRTVYRNDTGSAITARVYAICAQLNG